MKKIRVIIYLRTSDFYCNNFVKVSCLKHEPNLKIVPFSFNSYMISVALFKRKKNFLMNTEIKIKKNSFNPLHFFIYSVRIYEISFLVTLKGKVKNTILLRELQSVKRSQYQLFENGPGVQCSNAYALKHYGSAR